MCTLQHYQIAESLDNGNLGAVEQQAEATALLGTHLFATVSAPGGSHTEHAEDDEFIVVPQAQYAQNQVTDYSHEVGY
jgi:hypothetical protein